MQLGRLSLGWLGCETTETQANGGEGKGEKKDEFNPAMI